MKNYFIFVLVGVIFNFYSFLAQSAAEAPRPFREDDVIPRYLRGEIEVLIGVDLKEMHIGQKDHARTSFIDLMLTKSPLKERASHFKITTSDVVNSIVLSTKGGGFHFGRWGVGVSGSDTHGIQLEDDEYLVGIFGTYGAAVINSIGFNTNKKAYGPWGGDAGELFLLQGLAIKSLKFTDGQPRGIIGITARILGDEGAVQERIIRNALTLAIDPLKEIERTPITVKTESKRPVMERLELVERIIINANPIEVDEEERVVNIEDGRRKIEDTRIWPYSPHGLVKMSFGTGSGTLIAPCVVLTAGHNLYDRDTRLYADNVQFMPAINGDILPYGRARVLKYYVPESYVEAERDDYALLFLDRPLGYMTGYYGVAVIGRADLMAREINVTGYPGDKKVIIGGVPHYSMWGMSRRPHDVDEHYIRYKIDTFAGQSGSGVWYNEDDKYLIPGIHVQGGAEYNKATYLTMDRYARMRGWVHDFVAENFAHLVGFIHTLDLSHQNVTDYGVSKLLEHALTFLRNLDLSHNRITSEGAGIIADSRPLLPLQRLALNSNNIGCRGVRAVAGSDYARMLDTLDVRENNVPEGEKPDLVGLLGGIRVVNI